MEQEGRNQRKQKQGVVVANKMQNTVVVKVSTRMRHSRYDKVVDRHKKYYADYRLDQPVNVGDKVTIMETRPMSKLKSWRVVSVTQG